MRVSFVLSLEVMVLTVCALGLLGIRLATARSAARVHLYERQLHQLQGQLEACQVKIAQAHQPEALLKRVAMPLGPPSPEHTVWLRKVDLPSAHSLRTLYEVALDGHPKPILPNPNPQP